ncbi:MAG: Rhodanese domain protein [Caulobacteraceae bacterium]|nr:Rhodanese domain protein [Caulobacteraceae bacterium]
MHTGDPLVSTAWLQDHLSAPDVRIVDGSWHLPTEQRDARAEYRQAHIPGAVFFDIDEICDEQNPLPHMLPHPVKFSSRMRKLGLGDGSRIVVYDTKGLFSAARVWWMLRVMGHQDVVVLDGGLPKWISEGRPIEDLPPPPRERHFTVRFDSALIRSLEDVGKDISTGKEQVVDARPAGRFEGREPEPRPGVRSGHIPGSRSLPWETLLGPDGALLPPDKLAERFKAAGVDPAKPVVTTCGSGVSAAILALALARLGRWRTPVYDGSWAEWGSREDLPLATGAA